MLTVTQMTKQRPLMQKTTHFLTQQHQSQDTYVTYQGNALVLSEGRVRGSGAGMDPPEGSVLQDGWWVYRRTLQVPVLRLAVSGATGRGWQLCTDDGGCRDLEAWLARDGIPPPAIEIRPDGVCDRLPR